jgi:hypothetical protein
MWSSSESEISENEEERRTELDRGAETLALNKSLNTTRILLGGVASQAPAGTKNREETQ